MSFLRATPSGPGWVLAMATISMAASVACVGDTAAPAGNDGTEGNDCFANETCNAGLECYRGRCRTPDAGASGSSSSSSGSVVTCGEAPPASPLRGIRCGGETCNIDDGVRCCEAPGTDATSCVAYGTNCAPSHRDWQCVHFENCATGNVCCLAALDLTSTCPRTAEYGGTRCTTSCLSSEVALCLDDSHCSDGKTCQPLNLADPDPRAVGACL